MPKSVFVDTSAWLAVVDVGDSHHIQAVETYTRLLNSPNRLVTSILVVAESQIWLRRRIGAEAAHFFLQNVNNSPRVDIFFPDAGMEKQAKKILEQFSDQDFSLTDAISFAMMKAAGIKDAFTYDKHFTTAGFTILS